MKCGQNKNILISIILQWSLNQEESEDDCGWEISAGSGAQLGT